MIHNHIHMYDCMTHYRCRMRGMLSSLEKLKVSRKHVHQLFSLAVSTQPVDGKNPAPVEVGSLSHDLQGFVHPRRLFGISSINSIKQVGITSFL